MSLKPDAEVEKLHENTETLYISQNENEHSNLDSGTTEARTIQPSVGFSAQEGSTSEPIDDDMIIPGIKFINYRDESQIDSVMKLVGRDLSEPYSGEKVKQCTRQWYFWNEDCSQHIML